MFLPGLVVLSGLAATVWKEVFMRRRISLRISLLMILVMLLQISLSMGISAATVGNSNTGIAVPAEMTSGNTAAGITVKASKNSGSAGSNVTDSVLRMTGAKAAKKLGITYISTTSHISHLERHVRGSYIRRTAYRKGGWNIHIRDKKTAFYGCKVGMTKKQAAAKMKKAKWKKIKTCKWDDGTSYVSYKPTSKKSYAYKTKGTVEVWFDEKGKVYRIDYCVG